MLFKEGCWSLRFDESVRPEERADVEKLKDVFELVWLVSLMVSAEETPAGRYLVIRDLFRETTFCRFRLAEAFLRRGDPLKNWLRELAAEERRRASRSA